MRDSFRRILFYILMSCAGQAAAGTQNFEIPLWGAAPAPGSEAVQLTERVEERSANPAHPDRMYRGIAQPSIIAFLPQQREGAAVVIAPGGGYTKIAYDKEGAEIARHFNTLGIAAFVLKYRLPDEGHVAGRLVPLQDGQRAIRLVRARAAEWGIDPKRIGIIGFSAGGHLAAATALEAARATYPPRDEVDALSARPDFMVLIYGAAAFNAQQNAVGIPESSLAYRASGTLASVRADAPPGFIFIAGDDARVPPEANVGLWQALRRAGVPAELHVAMRGGHAFALMPTAAPTVRTWPRLLQVWMGTLGLAQPPTPEMPIAGELQ